MKRGREILKPDPATNRASGRGRMASVVIILHFFAGGPARRSLDLAPALGPNARWERKVRLVIILHLVAGRCESVAEPRTGPGTNA